MNVRGLALAVVHVFAAGAFDMGSFYFVAFGIIDQSRG